MSASRPLVTRQRCPFFVIPQQELESSELEEGIAIGGLGARLGVNDGSDRVRQHPDRS